MTVQRDQPFGDDTRSLSHQIEQAATRLDRRKVRARALGSFLVRRIRSEWASPAVLCVAGLAGFVIGDWIHRPMKEPHPSPGQSPSSSDRPQTAARPNAVVLMKIAQDLGMRWAKANAASGVRQRTDKRPSKEQAVNDPGC